MESASAVALRHPPPRPHLLPRKLSSFSPLPPSHLSLALPTLASAAATATTTSRATPVTARAAPSDAGDAQGSPEEPSTAAAPEPPSSPPKPAAKASGAGFGGGIIDEPKRKKGKQRGAVVRRPPVQKPSSLYSGSGGGGGSPSAEQREQTVYESAFLLTWLGLGLLILVEGLLLAASGFLPEEWDNFFVKYLYPSFTPTVFLFVSGTVAYGVFKYLQGEKQKR